MEENRTTIGKTALTYGLALSAILILVELLFYSLDIGRESKLRWVAILIVIGTMIMGVKTFRDKELGGFISYGQSVKLSFFIGLISAIILGVFMYIFVKFIDLDFIDLILEQTEEDMLEKNPEITDMQFDMAMEYTEKFTTPFWISIGTLFMLSVQAIIIALIISIFMKKQDDSLDASIN